jgi:hypothetical protein
MRGGFCIWWVSRWIPILGRGGMLDTGRGGYVMIVHEEEDRRWGVGKGGVDTLFTHFLHLQQPIRQLLFFLLYG